MPTEVQTLNPKSRRWVKVVDGKRIVRGGRKPFKGVPVARNADA